MNRYAFPVKRIKAYAFLQFWFILIIDRIIMDLIRFESDIDCFPEIFDFPHWSANMILAFPLLPSLLSPGFVVLVVFQFLKGLTN